MMLPPATRGVVDAVRWGADPTIPFWETGNELWDAPRAWTVQIAAHLRSLAPNALIGDGSGASGLHVRAANVALTDPSADLPWTLLVPATGQHRDRYEMYVPAENSEQGTAAADLKVHSAVMKASPSRCPTATPS